MNTRAIGRWAGVAVLAMAPLGCSDDEGSAANAGAGGAGGNGPDGGVGAGATSSSGGGNTTQADAGPANPPVGVAGITPIASGRSWSTGSFEAFGAAPGVVGRAMLKRERGSGTTAEIYVGGLTPDTEYMAHVHALPCSVMQGGGHYKHDPSIEAAEEANELWLPLTTDANGEATASVSSTEVARADAQSIVVHDSDGAKMLCADLGPGFAQYLTGEASPFADAASIDLDITGAAQLEPTDSGTRLSLSLSGLDPAESYVAHVHTLPCWVQNGGDHYKLDPSVVDTAEANELWFDVNIENGGDAVDELVTSHAVRPDAQSIVIHRQAPDGAPRVACIPFVDTSTFNDFPMQGTTTVLPAGEARYPGMTVEVQVAQFTEEGLTRIQIFATGVPGNQIFPAHVHASPCAIRDGGDHYLIDPTAAATPSNEMWLEVGGAVNQDFDHLPRVEAQSIVMHDVPDGTRLACVDLRGW